MKRFIEKITGFEDMFEIALAAANSYDSALDNDTIVEIVEDTFAGFLAHFIKRKNVMRKKFQSIKAAIIDFLEVYMENTRELLFQRDVDEIDLDDAILAFFHRYYNADEPKIDISDGKRYFTRVLDEAATDMEVTLSILVAMINRRFLLGEVLDFNEICFIYNTMEDFSKEMYRSMDESLHVKKKLPIVSYSGKISKKVLEPLIRRRATLTFSFNRILEHYYAVYFITNKRKRRLYNVTFMKMARIIDEYLFNAFDSLRKNGDLAYMPGISLVFLNIVNDLLWSGKLFKSYLPESMKELKDKISIIHEYGHWIETTFKLFYLLSVADLDNIIISFVDAESNE